MSDEERVRNIIQTIHDEMLLGAENGSAEFIEWYTQNTEERKDVIDLTLVHLCGLKFEELLGMAKESEA